MKKTLLVSSFCFLLVGGGLKSTPAPVTAETSLRVAQLTNSTGQISPSGQAQVQLLSLGAEPRQELRFNPKTNVQQTLKMTINMDITSSISNQAIPKFKIPTSVITMKVEVTQVDPNGDIHAKFSYTNAEVVDDKNVPPELINQMRLAIKKVVGLSGTFIFDNRGQVKSGSFVLPDGLDPMSKKLLDQVSNSLNQLSAPFPAEAVGKGAKWRVSSALNLGGINLTQNSIYELMNRQDNVATLNVSIEQQAQSQALTLPGLPSGVSVTLKSLNSQGQGQLLMPLDRVMPLSSMISVRSQNLMNVRDARRDKETTIETNLSVQIGLESPTQQ